MDLITQVTTPWQRSVACRHEIFCRFVFHFDFPAVRLAIYSAE